MSGCHQKPERSFYFKGFQFPLCARCTGAFLGQLLGFLWVLFLRPKAGMLLLLGPMAADGISQRAGWRESNNVLRFITGLLGGFGLVVGMLAMIKWAVKAACNNK